MKKIFDNLEKFWKEAKDGDELKAGVIKKMKPLFEKVYLCPKCNENKKDKFVKLIKINPNKFKCLKCDKEYSLKEIK